MTKTFIEKNKMKKILLSVGIIFMFVIMVACSDPDNGRDNETSVDSPGTSDGNEIPADIGAFDPNEGIGGFANAPYEEEAIHPTEVGWTRQSRFKGPENPVIDWTIELPGKLEGFDNAPIIDTEGNQLWKRTNFHEEYDIFPGGADNPAPMLNNSGQLIGMLNEKTIGSFDKTNGEIQFVYQVDEDLAIDPWYPSIGEDGTIYFVYAGGIYALTPEGEEKWIYHIDDEADAAAMDEGPGFIPTLSSDRLFTKNFTELMAFDLDGNKLWETEIGHSAKPAQSNIIIDDEDNLYFIHDKDVLSYTADGEERWRVELGDDAYSFAGHTGLGLSKDGTLVGLFEDGMYALDTDGNQLWHNDEVLGFNGVTFDSNGTIYFTAYSTLYAMTVDGEISWELDLENRHLSNPVIGPNQKIYLLSDSGFLTVVGEE